MRVVPPEKGATCPVCLAGRDAALAALVLDAFAHSAMVRAVNILNPKPRLPILMAASLLATLITNGGTLLLQQGADGYSGCTDSHIGTGGFDDDQSQNFGECGDLLLSTEHYNPG